MLAKFWLFRILMQAHSQQQCHYAENGWSAVLHHKLLCYTPACCFSGCSLIHCNCPWSGTDQRLAPPHPLRCHPFHSSHSPPPPHTFLAGLTHSLLT
jgi:hypothetical protein